VWELPYKYDAPKKDDHLVVPIDRATKEAITAYCTEILEFEKVSPCIRYMLKKYFEWARVMEKLERRRKMESERKKAPSKAKSH
jgi:hypothetical protein